MSRSLGGQIVLITGASSGFGADAARLFARAGCQVVLAARRLDRLQALAGQIRAAGGEAFAIPLDVTEQPQIEAAVQAVLERYGRIDILVNNAGFGRLGWFERLDPRRDIDDQINVNLRGLIQMTRAVLPSMLARRSGQIINVASAGGWVGAPLYTIYAATKFGVRGFTDALRRDMAPFGIQVSGIYPAGATTEFSQHTYEHPPRWNFKAARWFNMTSEYVAGRIVSLARHPRRALIIPWWMHLAVSFDYHFPGLVDWFLKVAFVRRFHQVED